MQTTYDPTNNRQHSYADCISTSLEKCATEFEQDIKVKIDECKKLFDEKLSELEKKTRLLVPAGVIQAFSYEKAPEGWLLCDGTAVSRTEYADLFKAIGTTFGAGDESTTFKVPDLRGQFLRGFPGGDLDPDRKFGSRQEDAIREIEGSFGKLCGEAGFSIFDRKSATGAFKGEDGVSQVVPLDALKLYPQKENDYPTKYNFKASNCEGVLTAHENRPVNVALLFCIKT